MGLTCKSSSHCNSRFEVKTKSSGGSRALKEPAIGDIELSDIKLDISDIEEEITP